MEDLHVSVMLLRNEFDFYDEIIEKCLVSRLLVVCIVLTGGTTDAEK
jgi:hypothetical protein